MRAYNSDLLILTLCQTPSMLFAVFKTKINTKNRKQLHRKSRGRMMIRLFFFVFSSQHNTSHTHTHTHTHKFTVPETETSSAQHQHQHQHHLKHHRQLNTPWVTTWGGAQHEWRSEPWRRLRTSKRTSCCVCRHVSADYTGAWYSSSSSVQCRQ